MKKVIVAIDGPAGSGKSTTAKLLAKRLGYIYIDTGAMYRAITLYSLRNNLLSEPPRICDGARNIKLTISIIEGENKVFINDEDVTDQIRSKEVNDNVSFISTLECVRKELVNKQRVLAENGGVVMEGRDIGTVVFPNAEVKIFLTASLEKRAERRYQEFKSLGRDIPIGDVIKNLRDRDITDSTRENSPLKKAEDAFEVDNSELSIEQQVQQIRDIILKKIGTIVNE